MARRVAGLAPPISAAPAGGEGRFVVCDRGANAFFHPRGIAFALLPPSVPRGSLPEGPVRGWGLHWGLEGVREVEPRGEGELPGRLNYLVGDESKWKTNHPTYERIVYKDARPGVDLAAESRAHGVKYSLHASPGAVGRSIALRYEGAREIRLLEGGAAIEVVTGTGTLREEGLVAYQEGPGGRLPVEAHYRVVGADTCAIEFGDFDPALPLVVDPTIGWSSYLGGVGTEQGFRGCPKCGQEKARRLLSTGSGLIFKGAGFYTTDYKRTSANSEPKSTAPANSGKVSQPATSNP